jgi:hypothetical protein
MACDTINKKTGKPYKICNPSICLEYLDIRFLESNDVQKNKKD